MGVKSSVDRRGPTIVEAKSEAKSNEKDFKHEDDVMSFSDSPRGSPRSVSRSPKKTQKKQFSHPELKLPVETIDFDVEREKEELMLMQDLESPSSKDVSRTNSYRSSRK